MCTQIDELIVYASKFLLFWNNVSQTWYKMSVCIITVPVSFRTTVDKVKWQCALTSSGPTRRVGEIYVSGKNYKVIRIINYLTWHT